jgi:hypothetical protein
MASPLAADWWWNGVGRHVPLDGTLVPRMNSQIQRAGPEVDTAPLGVSYDRE